mmetsp:Transcript_10200/g.15411  ORF Transcript_10200/g.15411 Transcript_10200/m.15411 type:complete len:269 (-) Transcript_10200:233-1039(-)|eukprot:CAMPEP_0113943542 /NCGR_PEP_ID=MMETSP1339-20121228/25902_1 /TAXON_ID=94617 /ORGANISM="Fibrocapsa japonica" /LENGTH=268 /DNA_ID=CAMNT_0000948443 /DNA_START=47 /DNA_END=853 /DNA_ORIENTATION=+ /assembly_acc=CAM_ASM_000762
MANSPKAVNTTAPAPEVAPLPQKSIPAKSAPKSAKVPYTSSKIIKCDVPEWKDLEVEMPNKEIKKVTLYVARLGNDIGKEWTIYRRYTEFLNVHEKIRHKYNKSLQEFRFPNKSKFNTHAHFTKVRRKDGFQDWLRLLVTMNPVPTEVLNFLEPIPDDFKMSGAKEDMDIINHSMSPARVALSPKPVIDLKVLEEVFEAKDGEPSALLAGYGMPLAIIATLLFMIAMAAAWYLSAVDEVVAITSTATILLGFWTFYLISRFFVMPSTK